MLRRQLEPDTCHIKVLPAVSNFSVIKVSYCTVKAFRYVSSASRESIHCCFPPTLQDLTWFAFVHRLCPNRIFLAQCASTAKWSMQANYIPTSSLSTAEDLGALNVCAATTDVSNMTICFFLERNTDDLLRQLDHSHI